MRLLADQQPELVTALAVAKEDYYTIEKFITNQCRLYTVMPLCLQLAMAPATQAYDQQCVNAVSLAREDKYGDGRYRGFTSAQGATLYRYGFYKLMLPHVKYMEQFKKCSYVTCGDDILFMVPLGRHNSVIFKIDCKHFDIGQCHEVLGPLVAVMREDMEKIDKPGARVWGSYYSERNILVGQINVSTRDMGPSGTTLQSKVNNPLATILCERVKTAVDRLLEHHFPAGVPRNGFLTQGGESDQIEELFPSSDAGERNFSAITDVVRQAGASLGFICKVERVTMSFTMRPDRNILAKYFSHPVPYLGYEHYYEWNTSVVVSGVDLSRWLAQAQFPKRKFDPAKEPVQDLQYLLVRMTTLAFNTGIVPDFAKSARSQIFNSLEQQLEDFCTKYSREATAELREADEEYSELTPLQLKSVAACLRQVDNWSNIIHSLWREVAHPLEDNESERAKEDWILSPIAESALPPQAPRVRVNWTPVDRNPTTIPIRSWRAVGRTQPRPLTILQATQEETSTLATARGRRKEHGRAGQQYLEDQERILDFDDESLPQGRRGGRGRRGHGN